MPLGEKKVKEEKDKRERGGRVVAQVWHGRRGLIGWIRYPVRRWKSGKSRGTGEDREFSPEGK